MEYMTVTYKLFFSKEHLRDLEKEGRDMQVEPPLSECLGSARSLPATLHRLPQQASQ